MVQLQVRANGLIVFVPKYGIEGPVYLEEAAAAAAAAADGPGSSSGGAGGRRKGGAAAADSNFIYDEEKQASYAVCVGQVAPSSDNGCPLQALMVFPSFSAWC